MDTLLHVAWLFRECTRPVDVPFKQTGKPAACLGTSFPDKSAQFPAVGIWDSLGPRGNGKSKLSPQRLRKVKGAVVVSITEVKFRGRLRTGAFADNVELMLLTGSLGGGSLFIHPKYRLCNLFFENDSGKSGCFWCFSLCRSSWPSFSLADVDKSCVLAGKEGSVLMSDSTRACPVRLLLRTCRAEGGQTVAVREQLLSWIRFANVMS